MEARTNNQTEEHMQILDFVMADPEIQKIRQVLQEKQEAHVYGLYEGQRMLITAALAESREK